MRDGITSSRIHGKMRVAATLGSDATGTQDLAGVRDRTLGARLYVEQPTGENVILRGGADVTLDHYDLVLDANPDTAASNASQYPPRNDLAMGMHLDAVIQATDAWEITPGIRVDMFESVLALSSLSSNEQRQGANAAVPSVDPRLLSRLRLSKAVTLVSTFGISHQPPAFFVPVPGLQLGSLSDGLQTSIQASQGVEVALPWAFSLTPTFFYHRYLGLTDFATTCGVSASSSSNNSDGTDCIDKRVTGRTIGFEMLLRRSLTQKLTGWLSYTLSRTTRGTNFASFDLSNLPGFDTPRKKTVSYAEVAGDFDRTHVLNVIGAYDLGVGWRAGARFYYYTGRPYSRSVFGYTIPPFNEERFPDFYRIDARLEKAWRVGEKGRIAFVAEWLNVTLQKEAISVSCGSRANSLGEASQVEHLQVRLHRAGDHPELGRRGQLLRETLDLRGHREHTVDDRCAKSQLRHDACLLMVAVTLTIRMCVLMS